MTSAEFKTFREALGLTLHHIAILTGTSLRTAKYWESRNSKVPEKASRLLMLIDKSIEQSVENIVATIEKRIEDTGQLKLITLLRYINDESLWEYIEDMRPLSVQTHAVMLARTKSKLVLKGIPLRIEYMRPDVYTEWLGAREHSNDLLSEWADNIQY